MKPDHPSMQQGPLRRAFCFLWLALVACVVGSPAAGHDSWISRGGLKNPAGEWCCGEGDCAVMDKGAVNYSAAGYRLNGFGTIGDGPKSVRERYHEDVPSAEVQPSPDGLYWRCKRPDGSRRCFFGPPPGS